MRDLLLGIGFGLISAATLSLSAVALSLQYSVTSVPNFAHGELMTVGAYAAYVTQQHTHSVPLELLAAIAAGGLLAYLINGFVLQPYSRRGAKTVTLFVLTIVVSFVVQALLELFFGGANVSFALNSDTAFAVGPFLFTTQNLIVIGAALLIMVLLHALLMYTPFGKSQRAVADSPELARVLRHQRGARGPPHLVAGRCHRGAGRLGARGEHRQLRPRPRATPSCSPPSRPPSSAASAARTGRCSARWWWASPPR